VRVMIVAAVAAALFSAPLGAVAGISPANPGPVTRNPAVMGSWVSLPCRAGNGDVSRELYVTNNTSAAIPSGTVIYWKVDATAGKQTLAAALAPGATDSLLGPPGPGGVCTASFPK